jgi:hypothetical protein
LEIGVERKKREIVALSMVASVRLDRGKGSPYMHMGVQFSGGPPQVNAADCTAFSFLSHVLPGLELCKGDRDAGDADYEI